MAEGTFLNITQAGELTASLLAIQVTNTTGVPTTPNEVIGRIQTLLARTVDVRSASYKAGQSSVEARQDLLNQGPSALVEYSTPTRQEALNALSGVFIDPQGNPQPPLRDVKPLFAIPGWLDGVKTIAATMSQLGFDRVLAEVWGQVSPLIVDLGKKLLNMLKSIPGFTKLLEVLGNLATGLADALPVLGSFVGVAFNFIDWLETKMPQALPNAYPQIFAPETVAIYSMASGRPFADFVNIEYNPVFREVFLRDVQAPGARPMRALDLDRFRESIATSQKLRDWIKNGPNSLGQIQSRPYQEVWGCGGYTGRQRLNNMEIGRGARGAFVAAAYLFGNTACVRNIGGWKGTSAGGAKYDQCNEMGYTKQSDFYDLGRGSFNGLPTISGTRTDNPSIPCRMMSPQYSTNWFAQTDAYGEVFVHPPIILEGVKGATYNECSAFRKWLFNERLAVSSKWVKLAEAPQQPIVPAIPASGMGGRTITATRVDRGCTFALPIITGGSMRYPVPSAVAAVGSTTVSPAASGTPAVKQVSIARPAQSTRLSLPLLPAGTVSKNTVAALPGGVIKRVAPGSTSTRGMPLAAKVAIGVGATAVIGTGGYLVYRKLKK